MNKKLGTFEFKNIRERFTVKYKADNTGWTQTKVDVFDNNLSTTEPIYTYGRNYSMLNTFEPFRLWDETSEKWRHFALISPKYTNFEVLDLDNKEIIAKNPPLLVDEEMAEDLNESYIKRGEKPKYTVGQDVSGWRFCPADFHIPDVYDILTESDIEDFKTNKNTSFWKEWMDNFLNRRTFGFEAGCVWGDDWSYKIQAIDLTRILQGEVSDDDRFGYLVLQGDLKDVYGKRYFDDSDCKYFTLNVPVEFTFDENNPAKVVKSEFYESVLPNFDNGEKTK